MSKTIINPWTWQDQLGYAQGIEVKHGKGTLYCAGQAAMTPEGLPLTGSMTDQLQLSLQNVERVIREAGYKVADIVRLNFYTTSVPDFFAAYGTIIAWTQEHQVRAASTLLQVSALAFPELHVEVEATVVR